LAGVVVGMPMLDTMQALIDGLSKSDVSRHSKALSSSLGGALVLGGSLLLACGTSTGELPAAESDSSTTAQAPAADADTSLDATAAEPAGTGTMHGSTTSSSGTTSEVEGSSGAPIGFDLGILPDAPALDLGCRKVDFLFVVDDSGSMAANQAQLLASFPGFIDAMRDALAGVVDSYHVGVITSDAYSGNAPGCTAIGDLVTQTEGYNSSDQVCTPFADGNRFATENDDLEEVFPCMAQVGTSGSPIEQPVTALIASLDPSKSGPDGCNAGFLRDDAILVVVIVTDDPPYDLDVDDAHLTTDTSHWYGDVIAAKHGDPEAVVVIGFVPWMDISCVFGSESPNLIGFLQEFGEQGVLASVCEPDYGPIFAAAVETIVTTCENFDPPG